MKFRRSLISTLAVASLLAPSVATASHMHVTIGFSHVTRDGVQKLRVGGFIHGAASCANGRHVVIQRRTASGGWKAVGHDNTNSNGAYAAVVADRQKRHRTVAPSTGGCDREVSAVRRHSH